MNNNFAYVGYTAGFMVPYAAVYNLNTKTFVANPVTGLSSAHQVQVGAMTTHVACQYGGTGMSPNFDDAGHGWIVGGSRNSDGTSTPFPRRSLTARGGRWTWGR